MQWTASVRASWRREGWRSRAWASSCWQALMSAAPADEQGESSGLLATARVVGQSLSVALAGAIFASFGGATTARILADQVPHRMLAAGEFSALQLTFLSSFRAAL